MQNLKRHPVSGVWRIRKQIPAHLRAAIGKREILISTQTKDYAEAKVRALPIMAEIEQQLARARHRPVDPKALMRSAGDFARSMIPNYEGKFQDPSIHYDEWQGWLRQGKPWQPYRSQAELDTALIEFGRSQGMTLEGASLDQFRQMVASLSGQMFAPLPMPEPDKSPSLLLSQLYEDWKAERRPAPELIAHIDTAMRRFKAQFGDLDIHDVTKKTAVDFKTELLKLPGLYGRPVSAKTVNKQLKLIGLLFSFAVDNVKLDANPFKGVSAIGATENVRRPFEPDDLEKLFGSKWDRKTGAFYWVPLIALFTGMRMNEITQLHRDDVAERDGCWTIRVDTRHEGQRLKNDSSRRIVPVHPRLIALDWIEWVGKQGEGRLFPIGRQSMSNHWGKYSDQCGVTDPEKTFHSLRHSFVDACRRAKMGREVQDSLTGHSTPGMGSNYGSGYDIPALHAELSRISFPGFPR